MNFKDVSNEWGTGSMKGYYNGAAYADLDNDGNVDVVINSIEAPAVILKNNAVKKIISLLLLKETVEIKMASETKAYLFTNGKMQFQELMPTRGFNLHQT